jgi:phage shock protein E
MGFFDFLFGPSKEKIQEYLFKDAVILDVRSKEEFNAGNIKGSKNIALQDLQNHIEVIKKWNKPIIACCRSGNRSGMAKMILQKKGIDVINGGGWVSLQKKL